MFKYQEVSLQIRQQIEEGIYKKDALCSDLSPKPQDGRQDGAGLPLREKYPPASREFPPP